MRRLAAILGSFAGFGAAACAGASPPTPRLRPIASATPDLTAPAYASPARWEYHPSAPGNVLAHLRLPDGSCVIGADYGQRWLVKPPRRDETGAPATAGRPTAPRPCSGKAEAAEVLAPEELLGVVRRSATSWLFVGASGTLYESTEPLGPITRTIAAPEPFARVGGSGGALVGATVDGRLVRWEEGRGWRPGPDVGARVFDLAFGEGGRVLALALPEALFTSEDGGLTFTPAGAAAPPIGARRVGLTATGQLLLEGFTASLVWTPRDRAPFTRSSEPLLVAPAGSDLTVDRAANATAVTMGRAAIDGERYLEAIAPDDESDPWQLGRGRLDGRLELRPMKGTAGCGALKLGANGRQVVVVCSRAAGDDVDALVLRSEDGGTSFAPAISLVTDSIDHVAIAVARDGSALIAGTCKPGATGACKPGAPMLVRPDGKKSSAMVSAAAQLGNLAVTPAFSFDGRSAYFLGTRTKDDKLALFVSHDGGESFAPRPLDSPEASKPRAEGDDDEGDGEQERSFELDENVAVRPGDDGTVGVRLVRPRGSVWLTTDEDGRVLGAAPPPTSSAHLGGVGRYVLAISPEETRPGAGGTAWESLDGGGTWTELPTTRAFTRELSLGPGGLACGAGGCLVGDTVARVGWSGQTETLAVPPPATDGPGRGEPATRTPIVCELSAAGWTRMEGVVVGRSSPLPDENQAARGRAVWSVLTRDRASGAISAVAAMLPPSGEGEARIVTHRMLGPVAKGARTALDIAPQMEGYAAVRVKLPLDAAGKLEVGSPMAGLEVGWENFMDGTSAHATIADAGPFERGDVQSSPADGDDRLEAALVSVSLKGLFVRPHGAGTSAASMALFIDPAGKVERFEYPPWPTLSHRGRRVEVHGDAVIAEGSTLGVARVVAGPGDPRTVLLGRPPAPGSGSHAWELTATSVAPAAGALVVADEWTYVGSALGFTTLVTDAHRDRAWGFYHPFRGDGTFGPLVPVPTQLDLPDRPRACSATERATTARMENPLSQGSQLLFIGTRHPVLVTEAPLKTPSAASGSQHAPKVDAAGVSPAPPLGGDAYVLLTGSAVLHGTPASPCLAAWQAVGVARAHVSAVIPGDLAHSWLFRPAATEALARAPRPRPTPGKPAKGAPAVERPRDPAIEVRPMACRFDANARVPESAWNEPGAVRTGP